jgi:hypothetical protein
MHASTPPASTYPVPKSNWAHTCSSSSALKPSPVVLQKRTKSGLINFPEDPLFST